MKTFTYLRGAAPWLVMGILFYLSSQPGNTDHTVIDLAPSAWHNSLHVPAYAALAASWHWAQPDWHGRRAMLRVALLCVGFGLTDEWHQSLVPARECSTVDLLRDALGALLGSWAWTTFRQQWTRHAVQR